MITSIVLFLMTVVGGYCSYHLIERGRPFAGIGAAIGCGLLVYFVGKHWGVDFGGML
jgi:hypothetical protein